MRSREAIKERVESRDGWLTVSLPAPDHLDPIRAQHGGAGPWKLVPAEAGLRWVAEVPLADLDLGSGRRVSAPQRDATVAWLCADVPERSPVASDDLNRWVTETDRIVHTQGQVTRITPMADGRAPGWTAQLGSVPADLGTARRAWLEALLVDAQSTWRMVRFRIDAQANVHAGVALTGLPESGAEAVVRAALESLARAVSWVSAPLGAILDPHLVSVLLDRRPAVLQSTNR